MASIEVRHVIGARPQFIKAAILSHAIRSRSTFEETVLHTGQHYDSNLSEIFFEELGIPTPTWNLGVGSGHHGKQTAHILEGTEANLLEAKPDIVVVYGDTNSTLGAALAAAKLGLQVAHVESGLRSYDRDKPEELNRKVSEEASDFLFTPSRLATENLREEGFGEDRIFEVGDVMYDAALYFRKKAEEVSHILSEKDLEAGYILATVHRAENTDDTRRLENCFRAFQAAAEERRVVIPLHPRTRHALEEAGEFEELTRGLDILSPVGYLDMMSLEANARLIVTDSGGVQKEAFFHKVPCVTLLDRSEWEELEELGWNHVISPGRPPEALEAEIQKALDAGPGEKSTPYGEGDAGERIVDVLEEACV